MYDCYRLSVYRLITSSKVDIHANPKKDQVLAMTPRNIDKEAKD